MTVAMAEKGAGWEAETLGGGMGRKEKRKALKKQKRKQTRKEVAAKEREEEEAKANDPEEQLKVRLREQEEAEIAERERKAFEEHERLWLEAASRRAAEEEEEQSKRLLEESQKEKVEHADEPDEGDDWEYVEDGPAEIIWRENEIIVKKKRVKVPKRNADQQPNKENDDRPTSNPLPPQSAAFTAFKSTHSVSAQEVLENVAQQIPNFGTEQDKAHCPFHLKTAACRFGSRCSRVHFYPDKSCTLLMKNMYNGPGLVWEQDEGLEYTDEEVEHCYEEFYEDVHTEFLKFGEIVNFKVCRNGSFHLRGNVYVHYKSLESALLAYNSLNGRYFAGKQITCEFVAITRWKAAICGEYMKSRLKTCSHGTACNFIHCFRNPGGDYEWADWDNPPPKHWVKKMAALFGFSLDIEYDKHADMEKRERPSDSSWKRRHKSSRYHSSGSRYGETDIQDSDSGRDASDGTRDRHSRHSSRRRHSHKRRKDMYSPDKPGNSEGNYYTGAHHTNGNHTSCDHESNEDYFGGEELDDKLKFKQRENRHEHDRYDRKWRRGESSNHAREKVPVDERDKSSVHKSQYHEKHSKRKHGSSDWDSGRDYSDDNSDQSNCHSSERTPYEYDYYTHDDDLKYKEKNDFGDRERLDRKFKRADSSKQTKGRVFLEEQREAENKRKSQGSRNRRNKSLDLDSVRDHGDNEEQSEIHSSEKASKHHVNPHERYTGELICDDHGSDRKISCENRSHCSGCSDESKVLGEYRSRYHTKYMSNDNGHDKKISHRKQFACDENSSGGSDDDRVYGDTEFVEEEMHSQFIHNRSSRSHIWTDVRGNKHSGSCFKKDKNHQEMGDGEEIKEENRVAGSGNLESEKGTIGKHSRSRTPLQYSSSSRSERSHHRDHVPHDSLHM